MSAVSQRGAANTLIEQTREPADDLAGLAAAVLEEEARRQAEQDARSTRTEVPDGLLPGVGGDAMPLRAVLAAGGTAQIAVLAGLLLVDALDNSAFAVLGPDVQRTLHLSDLGLGVVGALGGLLLFSVAIPLGHLGDRTRRTAIVGVCSTVWAAFALVTGLVVSTGQLVIARVVVGLGKANEQPVHNALIADTYPLEGRNRVYGLYRAAQPVGFVLGPVLAGAIAAAAGGGSGWRWAFVILALPAALLALAAFRLKEPARGLHEQRAVLGEVLGVDDDEPPVTLSAAILRLRTVRTFQAFTMGLGALGFAVVAAPIYINLILEKTFGLGSTGRGLVDSLAALGGVVGVLVAGTYGDRLFRADPTRSMRLTGGLVMGFGIVLAVALYMPDAALYTVFAAVANALLFGAFVPTSGIIAAVTPYRLRSTGFATAAAYLSLLGGVGGALLVGALGQGWGDRAAIAVTAPLVALVGGGLIARGSQHIRGDLAAAAGDLLGEREERRVIAEGGRPPMLQVRNLDFSYGPVQVLFDVTVDVQQGEVLALLGTNGAGKSTLLRAISGLGLADRGVIRLQGRTITLSDPRTRVGLGIVQVPGGKAVFPALSVRENLLAAAAPIRRDTARVRSATERVIGLFPVLGQRMDQPAGTLSGGEQQMLGIAMALMLEPKVLLIDELSLGLAPVVVQQLLEIVEQLKREGLTIVIVEQSVNVALAMADRAIFMEKGQVRFQGRARDLLERDDLIRAVFLGSGGG